MAKANHHGNEERSRLLRALAFHIHRKRSADEVLREHIDQKMANGQRREYREADETLTNDGFVATLRVLGLIGGEAAAVLAAVIEAKDHRLLADALGRLADLDE